MKFMFSFFLILCCCHLEAFIEKKCEIVDVEAHQANQQLLYRIIEKHIDQRKELAAVSSKQQASILGGEIAQIAAELNEQGFQSSAYRVPEAAPGILLCFSRFLLWEGALKQIPLTFFAYIWPPQQEALKYMSSCTSRGLYATAIHDHPIYCAFAPLQGIVTQQLFTKIPGSQQKVILDKEENFHFGQFQIDDLSHTFIHRLVCRDLTAAPCITLHAYGLSTQKEVLDSFLAEEVVYEYESTQVYSQ